MISLAESSNRKVHKWHRNSSQTVYEIPDYPTTINADSSETSPRCCALCLGISEGICYMILGVTLICIMQVLSKIILERSLARPIEIAYFRFLGLFLGNLFYSLAISASITDIRQGICNKLTIRAIIGSIAHICYLLALAELAYLRAVVLSFAGKFIVSFVQYVTCCKFSIIRCIHQFAVVCWLVILTTFSTTENGSWGPYLSLVGSFSAAGAFFVGNSMHYEVHYIIPSTYLGACGGLLSSLILFGRYGKNLHAIGIVACIVIGLIGWAGQLLQSLAMQKEAGWKVGAVMFLMLGYGVMFEVALFGRTLCYLDITGIIVLICSEIMYCFH